MKLLTRQFTPTGETLWLDYDPEAALGKNPIIALPGSAKLPPFITAEVIEAGPKATIKKGDTVLLNSVVVTEVKLDREIYYFTTENKIIAIVKPAEVPVLN